MGFQAGGRWKINRRIIFYKQKYTKVLPWQLIWSMKSEQYEVKTEQARVTTKKKQGADKKKRSRLNKLKLEINTIYNTKSILQSVICFYKT